MTDDLHMNKIPAKIHHHEYDIIAVSTMVVFYIVIAIVLGAGLFYTIKAIV